MPADHKPEVGFMTMFMQDMLQAIWLTLFWFGVRLGRTGLVMIIRDHRTACELSSEIASWSFIHLGTDSCTQLAYVTRISSVLTMAIFRAATTTGREVVLISSLQTSCQSTSSSELTFRCSSVD